MNGKRFAATHSVRFKYLLLLFVLTFLASAITYGVMFWVMHDRMNNMAQEQLQNVVDMLVVVMDKSGLSSREVLEIVQPKMSEMEIYNTWEELPVKPGNINPDRMADYKLYMRVKEDRMIGIMRLPDGYLYLSPEMNQQVINSMRWLVLRTLAVCAGTASIFAAFAICHATKPLRALNKAIRQVACGNFDVRVKCKNKDEMGIVVRNFNWMVGELRSIECLRRDFVSSVSHELKTPIASIQGGTKLLTSTPFDQLSEEKFKKYTGLLQEESSRMSGLVSNLLRLSKLEAQKGAEKIERFSLDEQLRQTILLLEAQWSAKNIEWDIQLERADYLGDEELICQVWVNLVSNAVKFTAPGGKISVTLCKAADGILQVEIADSGIGMSEETQARLFEKFYQGDVSRAVEGSGLGLSIVKRILDLHGAAIAYKSALGNGTICTVTLPPQ